MLFKAQREIQFNKKYQNESFTRTKYQGNTLKVRIDDIDRQISNLMTQRDTAHKELAAAQP